jgi:hypothetical protein
MKDSLKLKCQLFLINNQIEQGQKEGVIILPPPPNDMCRKFSQI